MIREILESIEQAEQQVRSSRDSILNLQVSVGDAKALADEILADQREEIRERKRTYHRQPTASLFGRRSARPVSRRRSVRAGRRDRARQLRFGAEVRSGATTQVAVVSVVSDGPGRGPDLPAPESASLGPAGSIARAGGEPARAPRRRGRHHRCPSSRIAGPGCSHRRGARFSAFCCCSPCCGSCPGCWSRRDARGPTCWSSSSSSADGQADAGRHAPPPPGAAAAVSGRFRRLGVARPQDGPRAVGYPAGWLRVIRLVARARRCSSSSARSPTSWAASGSRWSSSRERCAPSSRPVILLVVAVLMRALVRVVMLLRPVRSLGIVSQRGEITRRTLFRAITVLAVIAWVMVTLRASWPSIRCSNPSGR